MNVKILNFETLNLSNNTFIKIINCNKLEDIKISLNQLNTVPVF